MKIRTTAIAMAVAGIVAAPMAAQAEGEIYAVILWALASGKSTAWRHVSVQEAKPTSVMA